MNQPVTGILLPVPRHRQGAALVAMVVVLAMIAAIMATTAWQMMAGRHLLERHEQKLQASWLARAGIEIAVARILSNPANYSGETVQPMSRAEVRIRVQAEPNSSSDFRLISEARYPTDSPRPAVQLVSFKVRRVALQSKFHVQVQALDSR
jgi:type II secretory pathway pseudopilin PulG